MGISQEFSGFATFVKLSIRLEMFSMTTFTFSSNSVSPTVFGLEKVAYVSYVAHSSVVPSPPVPQTQSLPLLCLDFVLLPAQSLQPLPPGSLSE